METLLFLVVAQAMAGRSIVVPQLPHEEPGLLGPMQGTTGHN